MQLLMSTKPGSQNLQLWAADTEKSPQKTVSVIIIIMTEQWFYPFHSSVLLLSSIEVYVPTTNTPLRAAPASLLGIRSHTDW